MGPKIRILGIIMMLSLSTILSFHLIENITAQGDEPQMKDVYLLLHGDPGNATMNTSYSDTEEHLVLTTSFSTPRSVPIPIGEWESQPISYPMTINGSVQFFLLAKGNLQQVSFSAHLLVNGVEVTGEMSTSTENLNESFPTPFVCDPVSLTQPLELNTSDIIGFNLSLEHRDPNFRINPKNVTLIMDEWSYPSSVLISTNSMHITKIEGWDDPESDNWKVSATIKCSFGYEDFKYADASSRHGGSFLNENATKIDDATWKVEWDWDYTITEGGSYEVKITAVDQNGNRWQQTDNVHITQPDTEIDFSITEADISFSNDPKKDENTTITAKITGSGKRWGDYQVDVEIYDGSTLLKGQNVKISRARTNEVSVIWLPDSTGNHAITVKIDPDDEFDETAENNNEATVDVEVTEGEKTNQGAGMEAMWAIAIVVIIIILIIIMGIRQKE